VYSWIFRQVPGPLWLRLLILLALIAGALVLMVQLLFPWMSQLTPFTDSTIGSTGGHQP
jgi:polyferredoxin